ncbi:TrkH family potassium uptake protein [Thermoproteota archaeon]
MVKKIISFLNILSAAGCLVIAILLALEIGFHLSDYNRATFSAIHSVVFFYFMWDILVRLLIQRGRLTYFVFRPTDLLAFYPFFQAYIPPIMNFAPYLIAQTVLMILMVGRVMHINFMFRLLRVKPAQMLIFGFLFIIFIGSLLLSLPIASTQPGGVDYVDSLFTASSAVCVTGLITKDTGIDFSFFGQCVILFLIQIGGLGIMTFSALLAIILNRTLSHRESQEFQETYLTFNLSDTFSLITFIFKFTLLFEAVGAVILYFSWSSDYDTVYKAVFSSIFHSVSAFCNAGFSTFSDSFTCYAVNPVIILTVSSLIIVGGIGFPVILNIKRRIFSRGKFIRLRLHTKMVLVVTLVLLLAGTAVIFLNEYNHGLAGYSIWQKGLISFFHSVSARTCGFNSVDLNMFGKGSLLILMVLMYIGASAGSTGGGVKTTTVGVLLTAVWNNLRGHTQIEAGKRVLNMDVILKALSIVVLSALIIVIFFFLVLLAGGEGFLPHFFETVSAFGTVGLSLGVTKYLSILGKVFIMMVMFIGRLGPLTVAFALSRRKPKPNYSYPEENVLIA